MLAFRLIHYLHFSYVSAAYIQRRSNSYDKYGHQKGKSCWSHSRIAHGLTPVSRVESIIGLLKLSTRRWRHVWTRDECAGVGSSRSSRSSLVSSPPEQRRSSQQRRASEARTNNARVAIRSRTPKSMVEAGVKLVNAPFPRSASGLWVHMACDMQQATLSRNLESYAWLVACS